GSASDQDTGSAKRETPVRRISSSTRSCAAGRTAVSVASPTAGREASGVGGAAARAAEAAKDVTKWKGRTGGLCGGGRGRHTFCCSDERSAAFRTRAGPMTSPRETGAIVFLRRRAHKHDRPGGLGDSAARLGGDREIPRRRDRGEIGRLEERAAGRVGVEDSCRDRLSAGEDPELVLAVRGQGREVAGDDDAAFRPVAPEHAGPRSWL